MEVELGRNWGFCPTKWVGERPDWAMSPLERSMVWGAPRGEMDPAKRNRARRAKKIRKARR